MDAQHPVPELQSLEHFFERFRECQRGVASPPVEHITGVGGCAPALLAAIAARAGSQTILYIAPTAEAATEAATDLRHLLEQLPGDEAVVRLLLPSESSPYDNVHPDRRAAMSRLATLAALSEGRACAALVTTATAICRRVLPASHFQANSLELRVDEEHEMNALTQRLVAAGYNRTPIVEDAGNFAVRGGLLDVWPPDATAPVRIDFFGDTIAEMKRFDPDSQRSRDSVQSVWLPPARQLLLTPSNRQPTLARLRERCDEALLPSGKTRLLLEDLSEGRSLFGAEGYLPAVSELVPLWQHVPHCALTLVEQPALCVAAIEAELAAAEQGLAAVSERPAFPLSDLYVSSDEIAEQWHGGNTLCCHRDLVVGRLDKKDLNAFELAPEQTPDLQFEGQQELTRSLHGAAPKSADQILAPLTERVAQWLDDGLSVRFSARTEVQAKRLASLLEQRDIEITTASEFLPTSVGNPGVGVVVGPLRRGLIARSARLVLVTEEEVFGKRNQRPASKRKSARAALEDLQALAPGDPVVHVEHGIGRYRGLERKTLGSQTAVDLLVVEYRGGDKLYVPVYRMNQIQKLSSADHNTRLDRLGGQTFAKTKAKARRKVRDMADELLILYAERQNSRKTPLPAIDDDYRAFEHSFPFEETPDQAAAIVDVLEDIDKIQVMDRLICGDVGFGKTEVALRAAFRHVLAGRQVALLCPTTVLANQHYHTLCRRFSEHPVNTDMLSRFRNKKQQTKTLISLQEGKVDIVVGTHRLLSKDVQFKRLGLLIVDEEQRFGVAAKERIKQLRKDVDVLTLSATPIPRTLQMAVGGLQDLSIIATAPADRLSIRTTTAQFDENLIREIIERELARGGQVYYVYNRIEGLVERAAMVQRLVPRAKIAVGHGQMRESELERTMLSFAEGKADILMATAIVESGLDIPRANTLIVDRADLFGLSQLYQLRGRVGRSSTRAFCYLLVPSPSRLTDEARMRVDALTRYTELGSGLQIAEMDLELRGAGDFLGAEQSGTVASVGFDLFCQMLDEATQELSGHTVRHEVDPEISLDSEALLPEDYVPEVGVRLSLYKRLASCLEVSEVHQMSVELEDRFGPLPVPAEALVQLMQLKTQLRKLRVTSCDASARSVTLHLLGDTPLQTDKVLKLTAAHPQTHRITPRGQIVRTATEAEQSLGGLRLAAAMLHELAQCQ